MKASAFDITEQALQLMQVCVGGVVHESGKQVSGLENVRVRTVRGIPGITDCFTKYCGLVDREGNGDVWEVIIGLFK